MCTISSELLVACADRCWINWSSEVQRRYSRLFFHKMHMRLDCLVTDLPLLFTFFSRYIQSRTCSERRTQHLLIRATGSDYEVSWPWNCSLCIRPTEGNSITFKCGNNFSIHGNMSCDVKSIIYVIKCRGCGEVYIWKPVTSCVKWLPYIPSRSATPKQEC